MIKFDFLRDPCDYLPWQPRRQIFDYVVKQHCYLPLTNPRASRNLFHRRIDLLINIFFQHQSDKRLKKRIKGL